MTRFLSSLVVLSSLVAVGCTLDAGNGESGTPCEKPKGRVCPDGTYYDAVGDVCVRPAPPVPTTPPPVPPEPKKEILEVSYGATEVWNTTIVSGGSVGTLKLRSSCDIEVKRVPVLFSGDTPSYKLKTPDGRSIFYGLRLMSLNEGDTFTTIAGPIELDGFEAYFDGTEHADAKFRDSFRVIAGKKFDLAVQVMILNREEFPEIAKSTWHYTTYLGDGKGFERGDILVQCPADSDWRILEEDEISYTSGLWGSVTFDPFLR